MIQHRREFLQSTIFSGSILGLHPGLGCAADAPEPKGGEKSPFLSGNFAPVADESTHDTLKVIGTIPKELNGLFVRNGPNPQFPPLGTYHWFDGDGMLHGVRIRDGKASYRNRYVRTAGWEEEKKAGKAIYRGLAEPPDLKKLLGGDVKKLFKNAANTSVVYHAKRFLTLWEGGEPYEVKVPDLDTVGLYNFAGKLKHPWSAHPKIDPTTGEMIGFGYAPIKPYVWCSIVNAKGELVRTMPVELPRGVMMHDFAITKDYAVFLDLPETFSFERVFKGGSPWKFEANLGARIGLLPRNGKEDKPRWFEIPACFVFHTLNAWQNESSVIIMAARYSRFPGDLDFGSPQEKEKPKPNHPVLCRWTLDLKTGKAKEELLDDKPIEFPRINDTLAGLRTKFGYAGLAEGDMFTGFVKYDLETAKSQHHSFGKDRFGGEGVFVPRPDGKTEDDGWLMTYLFDRATQKSEFVIVDARNLTGEPTARIMIPARVPYGFHGTWISL